MEKQRKGKGKETSCANKKKKKKLYKSGFFTKVLAYMTKQKKSVEKTLLDITAHGSCLVFSTLI